jgi:hypothetical protein
LKNLAKIIFNDYDGLRFDFQSQAQLSAISELLKKKSNDPLKWKRLAAPRSPRNPEPLFFLKSGKPLPMPDDKAPEFSDCGLLRGPIKLRGHAQLFPAKGMPSLLLRLRALLGVNARCELLCLLAATEEIHPSKEMRPLLADAGWGRQLEDDSSFRGVEYSAVFIRNIEGILSHLNQ